MPHPPQVASFSYPADGSIVSAQSTTASATTAVETNAAANAESVVTALSLFKGEITADAVTARASAGTGYSGAGGNANGSAVTNLKVEGQPVTPDVTKVALGDWGQLTIGTQGVDRTAPAGTRGYRGFVTELDVRLTADHGGLPASSEIQIGYAEAAAQTAPPVTTTVTTHDDRDRSDDRSRTRAPATRRGCARAGDGRSKSTPLKLHPKLTAGHYVFPVYGPTLVHRHVRRSSLRRRPTTTATTSSASSASRSSRSPTERSSRSAGTRSAATASGSSTSRGTSSTTRTSPRSRPRRRTART